MEKINVSLNGEFSPQEDTFKGKHYTVELINDDTKKVIKTYRRNKMNSSIFDKIISDTYANPKYNLGSSTYSVLNIG